MSHHLRHLVDRYSDFFFHKKKKKKKKKNNPLSLFFLTFYSILIYSITLDYIKYNISSFKPVRSRDCVGYYTLLKTSPLHHSFSKPISLPSSSFHPQSSSLRGKSFRVLFEMINAIAISNSDAESSYRYISSIHTLFY